jgi:hypothetical protein
MHHSPAKTQNVWLNMVAPNCDVRTKAEQGGQFGINIQVKKYIYQLPYCLRQYNQCAHC